jgi:hypothetical protein
MTDLALSLRQLAATEVALPPPYDFAEFRRRGQLRSGGLVRLTAVAATLSAVLLGAALWRYVDVGPAELPAAVSVSTADPAVSDGSPALVRAGHWAARTEIEERIAVLDAMLSESRVRGGQAERLRALEQGRSTLVDALQRVAYAHQLVEP